MTRLPQPDYATLPEELSTFLSALPPDPMVKMLAVSQSTAKPFIQFARTLFSALESPARARELVILTVAAHTDAVFVATQHAMMADSAGVGRRFGRVSTTLDVEVTKVYAGDGVLPLPDGA